MSMRAVSWAARDVRSSGLIVRPSFNLYFLMYTQIFLVTSVRGMVFPPQIFANASLSFFGAKMPFPAFFMADADLAFLPAAFFAAVIFFASAFEILDFVVV